MFKNVAKRCGGIEIVIGERGGKKRYCVVVSTQGDPDNVLLERASFRAAKDAALEELRQMTRDLLRQTKATPPSAQSAKGGA